MSETRKIQKIGNTLYVSIPKSWTDQLHLNHGENVTLFTQQDGSISIYPKMRNQRREIMLNVTHNSSSQSLKRGIIGAYLDGFDTINLKTKSNFTEEQHDSIRETIDNLFGLELIEVTGNTMNIVCLLKQTMPVNKAVTRIHNVIISMWSETISAVENKNVDLIKGLTRRTRDIKRLIMVTNRLLRSSILFPKPSHVDSIPLIDCVDYLQILHVTSEISGNLNKIAKNLNSLTYNQLPPEITVLLVKTGKSIQKMYDDSVQALLNKDIPLANNVLDACINFDDLWTQCVQLSGESELSSLVQPTLRLIFDSLEQIQHHAHEIAYISIDRTEAVDARASQDVPSKKSLFAKKLKNTK
ncbi:MAG: hypothetical protein P8X84_03050 [Candidatus Bathyarchaeota archaeon]